MMADRGLKRANTTTKLFAPDLGSLTTADVLDALASDPRVVRLPSQELLGTGLAKLCAMHRLVDSSGAAQRVAQQGGLYVNNQVRTPLGPEQLLDDRFAVVRAGKEKHLVLVADQLERLDRRSEIYTHLEKRKTCTSPIVMIQRRTLHIMFID
jgi:tyrosyl-tRNA synthetase